MNIIISTKIIFKIFTALIFSTYTIIIFATEGIINELSLLGIYADSTKNPESLLSEQSESKFALNYHVAFSGFNSSLFLLYDDSKTDKFVGIESKELYYQSSLFNNNLEYSIGRKVINRGIGYAFNPLEEPFMIKDRSTEFAEFVNNGTVHAGLTWLNNLGANQVNLLKSESHLFYKSPSYVIDYFGSVYLENSDLFWQIQAGGDFSSIGLAFNQTIGEATTIGITSNWHNNGIDYSFNNYLGGNPLNRVEQTKSDNIKNLSLLNLTYTSEANINLMLEIWHNGSVPDDEFWDEYIEFANKVYTKSLPPETKELLEDGKNFYQNNLMLRVGYNYDSNWKGEILLNKTISANNTSFGFKIKYLGVKDLDLLIGVVSFQGSKKSLYQLLPFKDKIYLELKWSLI